jgi:MoxR-like ATPase
MDAMTQPAALPDGVDATAALLARGDYVADRALATAVHLALSMNRPLFLEGEAGVGKTEIAKVLASTLGRRLVRLQCYDGLDLASALYDWNYPRQLLEIRLFEAAGARDKEALAKGIFDRRFLIERPLLQAISPEGGPAVLLIDELDRADEPFEAFLLELLADFQVTIPELGTIRAETPPMVILTSNRTREIHDALRRRCLYHWVDFPNAERERAILRLKAPQAAERLSHQVVAFVQRLRQMDLFKMPGVAETIDWCGALAHLDATELDPARVDETLGVLLKYQDDIARIRGEQAASLVAEAKAAG